MPFEAPGSLSSQQYLDVTAYLLLQNGLVSSGQAMDSASLGGIPLTK
jgi:adhesin HecA-like repeat protein